MPSSSHLVILPSYNTGPRLREVVEEVLEHWQPVLVVIDGSTDGSERPVLELAKREPALSVIVLPRNSGKGAAFIEGTRAALERGYTHALAMDADGQHPAAKIAGFMEISRRQPDAVVLGRPIFPDNTPRERLYGRKISIALIRWAMLGRGIDDPLYGFRVYPLGPLMAVLGPIRTARRYDFDSEAAVRLCWSGIRPINVAAPVKYLTAAEGGISHYHYLRDNLTLARMHLQLVIELLLHIPELLRHRRRWRTEARLENSDEQGEVFADAVR